MSIFVGVVSGGIETSDATLDNESPEASIEHLTTRRWIEIDEESWMKPTIQHNTPHSSRNKRARISQQRSKSPSVGRQCLCTSFFGMFGNARALLLFRSAFAVCSSYLNLASQSHGDADGGGRERRGEGGSSLAEICGSEMRGEGTRIHHLCSFPIEPLTSADICF